VTGSDCTPTVYPARGFEPPFARFFNSGALSALGIYGECSVCAGKIRCVIECCCRMKWLKRLLYLAAFILLGVIAFCLLGIYLYHGTPHWYHRHLATTQEAQQAANSADQKLIDLFSWAATAHAQELRSLRGVAKPSDQPIGPKTVTFNEDELNSFFASWQTPEKKQLQSRINRYFADGRVIFEPDTLILAGQSPAVDALVSANFHPSIDNQGKLKLSLGALHAGLLPLPRSALSDQFVRLEDLLTQQLAAEQQSVAIDPALTANSAALAASWLKLLLSALNDSPSDSILIIPFDMTNLRRGLPVKLTSVQVAEDQITLTVNPIAASERSDLENTLKQPWRPAQ
jgi:uncharacterized protein YpmS